MGAIGMAAEPDYLARIEDAHRKAAGENFCYAAVPLTSNGLYQLAIVRKHTTGYFPISEDFFIGWEKETHREANKLNRERMGLSEATASTIIASSMALA